ncbi:ANTAR domain-containing protein [Actinacidiphila alni]|uniref:ANTAR domain-containing protein n=1 Tax=Actinacidiphila alni TaxID=380248 RepID=A0A1I2JYR4_9ACTN|nr:ANTAR domain-containing protein [Actinacidiphila alni]SFF59263.1 ANTAR domain-containing protein [Actinacidiphila alni]
MRGNIVRLRGGAGWLWLVRAGEALNGPVSGWPEGMRDEDDACRGVLLDLSRTNLLSAAAAGSTIERMVVLRQQGRRVWLAGVGPGIERVLRRADRDDLLATGRQDILQPSVEAALAAAASAYADATDLAHAMARPDGGHAKATLVEVGGGPRTCAGAGAGREETRSGREMRDGRRKARGRPVVALAGGVVGSRYGLDGDAALELLVATSQRHNMKLRALAASVAMVVPPQPGGAQWFPGRSRRPAPALSFLEGRPVAKANPSEVLAALLRSVLEVAWADMGNAQLADPMTGDLWIEAQRGHSEEFLDYFDYVAGPGHASKDPAGDTDSGAPAVDRSSSHLAAARGVQVAVLDVPHDALYDAPGQAVMRDSGSVACHSVPIALPTGELLGMVTCHYRHPAAISRVLVAGRTYALDHPAGQAAAWLDWYRRTIVLDALEDLHTRARALRAGD